LKGVRLHFVDDGLFLQALRNVSVSRRRFGALFWGVGTGGVLGGGGSVWWEGIWRGCGVVGRDGRGGV